MSLSESLFGEPGNSTRAAPSQPTLNLYDIADRLSAALDGLYVVHEMERLAREFRGQEMSLIVFRGRLLDEAEKLYPVITERFQALGYTPMMEKRGELDQIVAIEGLIQGRRVSSPGWFHLLLLIITIITTTISGAQIANFNRYRVDLVLRELGNGNLGYLLSALWAGAPFALTLLLILGVHEMGHYIAARRHGVDVTLPYFIPFPLVGLLGTLGAVIFIKSPLTNRKALFDVGISGPLAGFVVALGAFIISLLFLRPSDLPNLAFAQGLGIRGLGMPILLQSIGDILRPDISGNLSRFVARQPVALAAWFGMLLTVLNLLPIGQLDGGHVMYTLFGRVAWGIALAVFGLMLFLGISGIFPSLVFFAFLALMTGLRHPPPGNDITPLDLKRKILGYATIVLFFLIGTATPFLMR